MKGGIMNQREILNLLKEAANSESFERRHKIGVELLEAAKAAIGKDALKTNTHAKGICMLLSSIFSQTSCNRPDLFPQLFPFFAAICGDRKTKSKELLANIDWSLVPL